MPLSCYVGRRDVMETVRCATISSTFGGDTLALAAARAAIDTYRSEDVIGHLWARGRQLQEGLNGLFRELDAPAAVSGFPPCCQIGFTTPDRERNAALFLQFERELLRRGVILHSVMYVNYSHTPADIDEVLNRAVDALQAMQKE
jgi:glutamate-1-semialdehyde aminotransferase